MPNRYFFATAEDLQKGLIRLEAACKIKYVEGKSSPSSAFTTYYRGSDLPELGTANHESGTGCRSFLVTEAETPILVRPIPLNAGGINYAIDQLFNPDSVVLQPGGQFQGVAFIRGSIASTCSTAASKDLLKKVSTEVTRGFVRVKAFWVGPEAYLLLKGGMRFVTAGIQSPSYCDLCIE